MWGIKKCGVKNNLGLTIFGKKLYGGGWGVELHGVNIFGGDKRHGVRALGKARTHPYFVLITESNFAMKRLNGRKNLDSVR